MQQVKRRSQLVFLSSPFLNISASSAPDRVPITCDRLKRRQRIARRSNLGRIILILRLWPLTFERPFPHNMVASRRFCPTTGGLTLHWPHHETSRRAHPP